MVKTADIDAAHIVTVDATSLQDSVMEDVNQAGQETLAKKASLICKNQYSVPDN